MPYAMVTNSHISHVYGLYYKAFEVFRAIPEIRTIPDNERYCETLKEMLREHLTVIPNLAIGVLEVQGLMRSKDIDRFVTALLKSVRRGVSFAFA